jgi:hypothetical protein
LNQRKDLRQIAVSPFSLKTATPTLFPTLFR